MDIGFLGLLWDAFQYTLICIVVVAIPVFFLRFIHVISNFLAFRSMGLSIYILLSFPGVVIHELSHYLMCIIFGHHVTKVRFFSPNLSSGSLGYVNHSYNPRSIYQNIGNIFIGLSPIICLPPIVAMLIMAYVPVEIPSVKGMSFFSLALYDDLNNYISAVYFYFLRNGDVLSIFLFFCLSSISLHSSPSSSDLRGALKGTISLFIILVFAAYIAYLIPDFTDDIRWFVQKFALDSIDFIIVLYVVMFIFSLQSVCLLMTVSFLLYIYRSIVRSLRF
ncbi:hypothetical protein A3715_17830 [Oleiphilus sp. HI0009]|nr:hypothetical protein A3715_17830 [Oleiphilus sp. HI0009]